MLESNFFKGGLKKVPFVCRQPSSSTAERNTSIYRCIAISHSSLSSYDVAGAIVVDVISIYSANICIHTHRSRTCMCISTYQPMRISVFFASHA